MCLDKLPEFEQLLASPRSAWTRSTAFSTRPSRSSMTPLLLNFLKVTARHGRLDCLRQIRSAARKLYNELRGRVEVTVETAGAISQRGDEPD